MPADFDIRRGGLGWELWWFDGDDWVFIMDSIHKADCLDEMWSAMRG